jgi:hypothetical protein
MANRLDFSAGQRVDPTAGLSNAMANASNAIGSISKQYMEDQRYKDQLKMQTDQQAENTRRWDSENAQKTQLFDAQMSDHAKKVQDALNVSNFVKNTNPSDVAMGIVKPQYEDQMATAISNKSLSGVDPSMVFDQQDFNNNIQAPWKDAVKQSFTTDPTRKAEFAQLASTVSQPQMEAVIRKKALAAGVPVDQLDTVIKSLGPMGQDYLARDKVTHDNRESDLKTLLDVAKAGSSVFNSSRSSSSKAASPTAQTDLLNTFKTGLIPYTGGARKLATTIYSGIMNDGTFTGPDGKTHTSTYAQRQQAANMVLNSNRTGTGDDISIDPDKAIAQARTLIMNGDVNSSGVLSKDKENQILMECIRKRALEQPATAHERDLATITRGLLGTAGNSNWGKPLASGMVPPPSVSDKKTITPTSKSALTPNSPNTIDPISLEGFGKAIQDAWTPSRPNETLPHAIGRNIGNLPKMGVTLLNNNPITSAVRDMTTSNVLSNSLQNLVNSNPIGDLRRGILGITNTPIVNGPNDPKVGSIEYNIKHGKPLLSTSP